VLTIQGNAGNKQQQGSGTPQKQRQIEKRGVSPGLRPGKTARNVQNHEQEEKEAAEESHIWWKMGVILILLIVVWHKHYES